MRAMTDGYDIAQICENGHHTNWQTEDEPLKNVAYCPKCGSATTTSCKNCKLPIRGCHYVTGAYGIRQAYFPNSVPAFCEGCGKAYPWTESRLEAARDLADQLGLDIPDRALVENCIEHLVRDTPRAPAEAIRFKSIVERAQPWALGAFKEVLYGILAEAVKKNDLAVNLQMASMGGGHLS